MQPTGITATLILPDVEEHGGLHRLPRALRRRDEPGVVLVQTPDRRAVVSLVRSDATALVDSVLFVHVDNQVEGAYEEAQHPEIDIVTYSDDAEWLAAHRRPFGQRSSCYAAPTSAVESNPNSGTA